MYLKKLNLYEPQFFFKIFVNFFDYAKTVDILIVMGLSTVLFISIFLEQEI